MPVFCESRGALFLPFFSKVGVVENGRGAMLVMRSGRLRLEVVSECWDKMRIIVRQKWESVQWVRPHSWPRARQELLEAHSAEIYSWWHDVYLCYGVVKLSVCWELKGTAKGIVRVPAPDK